MLGLGLFVLTQGVGCAVAAMNANAVRMIVCAGGGLVAIYGLDLGVSGFFAAVAGGSASMRRCSSASSPA